MINKIFKTRYYWSIAICCVLIIMQINFSSITRWNSIIPNTKTAPILGHARQIRADEWAVNLSWQMSQVFNHFKSRNYMAHEQGLNTVIAQYQAAWNIENIGRPINWGFLLFGASTGLSWYWIFKIMLLFISSVEFIYLLTDNKKLALMWGFVITYAPGIQWWSSNYIPELITSVQFVTCALYYLINSSSLIKKLALSYIIMTFSIGFIFIIYPPWQIPLGYMLIIFCSTILLMNRNNISKVDILMLAGILLIIAYVIYHFYQFSLEDIKMVLGTVYPGKRVALSGSGSFVDEMSYFANLFTPYKSIGYSNQSELSGFWSLFPLFPFLGYFLKNKNIYFKIILYLNTFFVIFSLVHVPLIDIINRYDLMFMVTATRLKVIIGLLNMYLLAMFIQSYQGEKRFFLLMLNITIWIFVVVAMCCYKTYNPYLPYLLIIASAFIMLSFSTLLLLQKKQIFMIVFLLITIATGAIINPVVIGINDLYGSELSKTVRNIAINDKDAVWATVLQQRFANYLLAQGVTVFNTTKFYPEWRLLNSLDPTHQYANVYNRYGHEELYIINSGPTYFKLPAELETGDIELYLNVNDMLNKTKIKYILSDNNQLGKMDSHFKLVTEVSGFVIYRVVRFL
jgi:hypothetical protein